MTKPSFDRHADPESRASAVVLSAPAPNSTTFSTIQYELPYSPGVERHFWHYARLRIVERHLRRTNSSNIGNDAIVMDVGCGVGLTVDYLRRVGIDCRGVELGSPKVRAGLEQFVATGTDARSLPLNVRERTGTILLLDVIEHIRDPDVFVGELCSAFPALEYILITVPARMELWSNYDVYYRHFLRYDKRELASLAKRVGLYVVTLKYFFAGLYPPMWASARLFGLRSLEARPPNGLSAWLHRFVGMILTMEERVPFLGGFPGTSLLAVLALPRSVKTA